MPVGRIPSFRSAAAIAVFAFSLFAAACGSSGEIPEADSTDTLAASLEAAGMRVDGPVENDFLSRSYFSIPGVQFNASGETVLAYEFDDPEELAAQRALVSPDGYGIGSKYIQWVVGPNYYQNGNLIVVYDGDKSLVTETLAAAMGEPFAGGNPA